MASFAALATRNFTTRLAAIWMVSPVFGLRPMRAARLRSTSLPMPGSAVHHPEASFRYEIVRKIFEGGMGVVYEAEQHGARNFVKRVAMKVIRQNYANQNNSSRISSAKPNWWPT
jgi:hypothetical protein